jgi:hypothetical protein
MPLPSSGPLSLTDIQTEFGGSNPIGLNEYYAGGGLVPSGTSGTNGPVPSSGQIAISNFYGTQAYYTLARSLRLRRSATASLDRTFGTPTSRRIFTLSFWYKRGSALGESQAIMSNATAPREVIGFLGSGGADGDSFQFRDSSNAAYELTTTAVFRDPSAWYHFVIAFDTTQATASNRIKMYVNGVQITAFSVASYPGQNSDLYLNNADTVYIGRRTTIWYLDGYLSAVYFIDGQQLTPSSFGATNSNLGGMWQPKEYTGTYGNNGFFLPFTNTASTTVLCHDFSGNNNNFTPSNISLTAGSTYDSMTDVPTLTSTTAANYGTLNPLYKGSLQTISNGNLTSSKSTGTNISDLWGNFGMTSGKWYFECSVSAVAATLYIGIGQGGGIGEPLDDLAVSPTSYFYGNTTGDKFYGSTGSAYGNTYTTGDVIGCAVDMDSGKIWWSKNGVFQASGDPAAGTNAAFTDLLTRGSNAFFVYSAQNGASNSNTLNWNFGQQPFAYTPPTGFLALNAFNL